MRPSRSDQALVRSDEPYDGDGYCGEQRAGSRRAGTVRRILPAQRPGAAAAGEPGI